MEINGLGNMGIAYHSLGGFGEAIKYQEATVAFGHVILDQNIISQAITQLGHIYRKQEQLDKATDYCAQAMHISRNIGDKQGESFASTNQANISLERKIYPEALDMLTHALQISRGMGDRRNEGILLGNLGRVWRSLQQYE